MRKHQRSLIKLIKEVIGVPVSGAEIGVFKGETSAILMEKFPGCHMVCVDTWKRWESGSYIEDGNMNKYTQEEWLDIKKKAVINISSVKGASFSIYHAESKDAAADVPDKSLDFVFIDSNHFYDGIRSDIEVWLPKTRKLLCGHDYKNVRDIKGSFGISRAVHEAFGEENIISRPATIWGYIVD
jgi:hypothetical protein